MNDHGYKREIRVRVRATGQVLDMAPDAARAMISGGTAEEVKASVRPETMTLGRAETAVAPAQQSVLKPRGRK